VRLSLGCLIMAAACQRTEPQRGAAGHSPVAQEVRGAEAEGLDEGALSMPLGPCVEACERVYSLLSEELGEGEGLEEMREVLREASGPPCVGRCQRFGDAQSVRCMWEAATVLELGACQGFAAPVR